MLDINFRVFLLNVKKTPAVPDELSVIYENVCELCNPREEKTKRKK